MEVPLQKREDKKDRYVPVVSPGGGGNVSSGSSGSLTVGTTTIASGTNTRILYDNAGVLGEYSITGTGNVAMSASPTFTGTIVAAAVTFSGTITQTSASATAFESGPNGSTNPVFRLVNNTASAATGLSITGNAAGSGVTLTALSSGSNENLILSPKGNGALYINPTNSSDAPAIKSSNTASLYIAPAAGQGLILFANNVVFSTNTDIGIARTASKTGRWTDGSTGAGNLIIGTSAGAIGTSGAGVLAFCLSTAPSTSPADVAQCYSADWNGAGTATLHVRNEEGHIFIYKKSAAYTPTNVTTDRSFDADTVAIAELADVVGTLIADLQGNGLLA